jgi:hypothetical protein
MVYFKIIQTIKYGRRSACPAIFTNTPPGFYP